MTDDVYTRQNFGNQVGMGRKPALLIVDFQVGFADPEVFGGAGQRSMVVDGGEITQLPAVHVRLPDPGFDFWKTESNF